MRPVSSNARHSVSIAVRRAARHLPGTYVCLPQALAGKLLLRIHGDRSRLVLGVKIDSSRKLIAHAWLVFENRIVLGEAQNEFNPVAVFE